MLASEYHRLLKRQLKKSGLDISEHPELEFFVNMVNDAYKDFDKDITHIENILEISSQELFKTNKQLKKERDHSNAQLQNVVNNVEGIIFETDLNGNFTFLNHAWERYFGHSIEESLGKSFKDFLYAKNIVLNAKYKEPNTLNREKVKFIFKYEKHNGSMWFEVKFKLIKNKNGQPYGFNGTIINVTNLKEIEIELKKASTAKDEFLSTMSHEIRTPLNAVTGLTNIMLMEEHLQEQEENLKALKYSGDHLLGLINDLLDFDKIKSGKLKIIEKDFNLHYLLENIKSQFVLRVQKKGLIFNFLKENEIPATVTGDELKLAQILKNLLSNSLKFTKTGSITLSVKNLGIDKNKINLEFKVIDTGIGISKNDQKTIFESFMQATEETTVKYGGTGLGLSISKKLLKIQGSDLKVESELNKGATFSFQIAFKVSNRLNVYEPEMVKMRTNYEPVAISVLVAEDNKMNSLILKRLFLKWQVDYQIAENGEEVLDILNKCNFDLILMDLQMPILDGYQTTKIIRKLSDKVKANIPIIALTAFAQTDIKNKTKQYKMNGFMSKPFNPEKLYILLKSYSKNTEDNSLNK